MYNFIKKVGVNLLSFLLLVSLMAPNSITKISAGQSLNPGEISQIKTATPTPGKVNTWDIKVEFNSRNHEQTSDIILVMDVFGSMRNND